MIAYALAVAAGAATVAGLLWLAGLAWWRGWLVQLVEAKDGQWGPSRP